MLSHSPWSSAMASGLALLLVVGLAGFFVLRGLSERPVNRALEAAQTSFGANLRQLDAADDLRQVQTVAGAFDDLLPDLRSRESSLANVNTDLGRASHRVVQAQVLFADTVAQLDEVSDEEFAWWGPVHTKLAKAGDQIDVARRNLTGVREESGSAVTRGAPALRHLEAVIGSEVAASTRTTLSSLLQDLAAAPRTVTIREIASTAALEGSAVEVTASALNKGSTEEKRLRPYVEAYRQLGALDVIDAENLDSWSTLRPPLRDALGAVESDLPRAGTRGMAVSNVDRVVRRARDRLDEWRLSHDRAVTARADDLAELRSYRTKMDVELQTYSALRAELSNWIDRVQGGGYVSYSEAYSFLSQAAADRQSVRDRMNGLGKPAEVVNTHQSLISVIDAGIAGVEAAYDGASDSEYCMTSCYYEDTPGWQRFRAESARITGMYGAAVDSWRNRINEAESSISSRSLPAEPVV